MFSPKILFLLIAGASFEFVGTQVMMIAFNFGQQAHLNDGITSSLVLFSPVFILALARLLYKERVNLV